jgi:prefoldin subunit 4
MQVVPAEEESDAEVRRQDQDNINRFARLNARLHEVRAEKAVFQVRRLQHFDHIHIVQCKSIWQHLTYSKK